MDIDENKDVTELLSNFMIAKNKEIKNILEDDGILISLLDMTGDDVPEILLTKVHAKFTQHEVYAETTVYDLVEWKQLFSFFGGWDSVKCYYNNENEYVGIVEDHVERQRKISTFIHEIHWAGTSAITKTKFAFVNKEIPTKNILQIWFTFFMQILIIKK